MFPNHMLETNKHAEQECVNNIPGREPPLMALVADGPTKPRPDCLGHMLAASSKPITCVSSRLHGKEQIYCLFIW